jgi:hypothetical protein
LSRPWLSEFTSLKREKHGRRDRRLVPDELDKAGSRHLEPGWPLHHVQEMLGHADLKQTRHLLERHARRTPGLHEAIRNGAVAPEADQEHPAACNDTTPTNDQVTVN